MTREEVQNALTKINESIAQLQSRLHPPPFDPGDRNELAAELVAAESSRDALEETLSNLPEAAAEDLSISPALAQRTIDKHRKAENVAVIKLSQAARKRSDALVTMMTPASPAKAPGRKKA